VSVRDLGPTFDVAQAQALVQPRPPQDVSKLWRRWLGLSGAPRSALVSGSLGHNPNVARRAAGASLAVLLISFAVLPMSFENRVA
jgi:hypothetical protein